MTRFCYLAFWITAACSTATNAAGTSSVVPPTTASTTTTSTSSPAPTTVADPPPPVVVEAPPQPNPAVRAGRGADHLKSEGRHLIGGGANASEVEQAICAAWGDGCAKAVAVARCESGLNPRAVNGPHRGLMQINVRIHARRIAAMGYTAESMFEVGPNLAVARALFAESSWRPWTCAR